MEKWIYEYWSTKCIGKDSKLFAYGVHQMQILTHSYYFHSIIVFKSLKSVFFLKIISGWQLHTSKVKT